MAKSNQTARTTEKKPSSEKKGSAQVHMTEEERALEEESKRLLRKATATGVLSTVKSAGASALKPAKTILKCDGKDIVKKGQRKSKYLFAFPGLMAPVAAGKLGELAHLDSRNPVLYIDFPQGRLKLLGTLVYPKNKYLTLQSAKGSGNIVCDDCFESLVVFSESCWVGKKEDNPEEFPLEMPEDLIKEKRHLEFSYAGGAGSRPGEEVKPGEVVGKGGRAPVKPRLTSPLGSTALSSPEKSKGKRDNRDESDSDEEGIGSAMVEVFSGPRRQSLRSVRKISYAEVAGLEDDDNAEDVEEIQSSGDEDNQSMAKRTTPVKRRKEDVEDGSPSVQHPAKSQQKGSDSVSGAGGLKRSHITSPTTSKTSRAVSEVSSGDKAGQKRTAGSCLKGSSKRLSEEDDKEMVDQEDDEMENKDDDDDDDDDGADNDDNDDDEDDAMDEYDDGDEDDDDDDWEG